VRRVQRGRKEVGERRKEREEREREGRREEERALTHQVYHHADALHLLVVTWSVATLSGGLFAPYPSNGEAGYS